MNEPCQLAIRSRRQLGTIAIAAAAAFATAIAGAPASLAQTSRPGETQEPVSPPSPLPPDSQPPAPPPLAPQPLEGEGRRVRVAEIVVTGSSVFGETEFTPLTAPLEGQTVSVGELAAVADAITQLYLNEGYLTTRAIVLESSLAMERVEIRVIEGGLEAIEILGLEGVRESYVRSRLERGAATPLNAGELEAQLRLLQINPLFERVEASLRAGTGVGQSVLIARFVEADPVIFRVQADNYSPPSIGGERLRGTLGYRSLTGGGDRLLAEYSRTTQNGSETLDLDYRLPLNAQDGTLNLRTLFNRNQLVTEELEDFEIEGDFELYEISFRQPLVRTPAEEFAIAFGFTHQKGRTFLLDDPVSFGIGPDEDGNSRVSALNFTQDYIRRSGSGAWALRSQFSLGVDGFDATINDDPVPDSEFFRWLGQVQRVQAIGEDHLLLVQADVQLTPDTLLPVEQFVIGGGQSVRGYRQNILAGDNGVRLSIEDRITVDRNVAGESALQLVPFLDFGAVFNTDDNPNELSQENTVLVGVGAGIIWRPVRSLSLRVDYGIGLVDVEEGDNIQDDGLYFRLVYE